jgi:hypothetical protein
VCAYEEQYTGTDQQNTLNYAFFYAINPPLADVLVTFLAAGETIRSQLTSLFCFKTSPVLHKCVDGHFVCVLFV